MREVLYFDEIAWPAAYVVRREPVPGRYVTGFVDPVTEEQPNGETLVIDTEGNGRSYQMQSAEGWWRDLIEVDTTNERQVLSFIKRRGDLFGKLKPGNPIKTVSWDELINRLCQAAQAWEPITNYFDISAPRLGVPYEHAKSFLHPSFDQDLAKMLEATYDGITPVLEG